MIEMRITTARLEDLPVLEPFCKSVYALCFADHWNEGGLEWYTELVYGTSQLTKDLSSPNVEYFLLYINESPTAFMKLKLSSSVGGGNKNEVMEVQKLYVHPERKGKGLGSELMKVAIEKARQLGKRSVCLEVLDTNHAAMGFYEGLGFKELKRHRLDIPYFKDELRGMVVMELVLR